MAIDLTSTNAKLARAKEHGNTAKDELIAWNERGHCKVTHHRNAEGSLFAYRFHCAESPPFQRWSLIIGDCLHNLRSALDHALYAVAIHESGLEPPPDGGRLMFPICETPDKFRDFGPRIRSLSDPIRAAIESFQPYNRPHPELPPLLGILNRLSNTDKHRLLTLTFNAVQYGEFGLEGNYPAVTSAKVAASIASHEILDGKDFAFITFDPPSPDMRFRPSNWEFVVAIVHGKRDPTDGPTKDRSSFPEVIDLLGHEVVEVIDKLVSIAKP